MKRTLIICIIHLVYSFTFSQTCINGIVLDDSHKAIPFATISDGFGHGTMADSLGNFRFCFPLNPSLNVLTVQALGYASDTVHIEGSRNNLTIGLKEHRFTINEVAVLRQQSIQLSSMASAFSTDKKEMTLLNPQNVAEVLQTHIGFTNRSGYQVPLTLRGMSGKRLLVLRNGLRRFSSYPSGFMSHTINVYDLERIDVEKGAASVLYGAGAMGGIINLIDKSPFKQKGFNGRFTTGLSSINSEKSALACGGWSNGKLALKSAFRYRKAEDFKYADGSIASNSAYTDHDFFFSAGYKFSEKQSLVLTTDIHHGGPWGKPVGFNGTDYMRVKTNSEHSDNVSLQYKLELKKLLNVDWSIFYSNQSRELEKKYYTAAGYMLSYVETTRFSDYYYGTRLLSKWRIHENYTLSAGTDFYSFHISTPTDAVDYIESVSFQNRVSHNARSYVSGNFLENKLQLSSKLQLVAGIRYDFTSVFEGDVFSTQQNEERNELKHAVSGNIAGAFQINPQTRLKLNVARSFRMPETTELYADSYTSNGILYGNPNLQPEYCNSLDVSYTQSFSRLRFEFSPFLWLMQDMIIREEFKGMPGTNYQYVNVGNTRIWGGELTADLPVEHLFFSSDKLLGSLGLSYLNGTDVSDSDRFFHPGTPINYMPPFNARVNLTYYTPKKKKTSAVFALRSVYYAEQKRLGDNPYSTPAYTNLGASVGVTMHTLKVKPSINISVNNLLNTTYYSYYSYLPAEGRDVRVFLTINLG